ncbi:O-antigen ligase family protein [Nibribacter koreensis]|uniref:O-antigen ligase-related domain-containing protein n=1 Tax=Nibribacter koreensis TaxID=1084519 RepID=A0ABP8F4V5_9BACT
MNQKEKILYALLLLFFVSLFTGSLAAFSSITTGALFLYGFYFNSIREKWLLLKRRTHVQAMLVFYGLLMVSALLSADTETGLHHLKLRLPLLLLPIGVGLLDLRQEFKEKVLLSFGTITCLVMFICLLASIYYSGFFARPEHLYNDALTVILERQSIYIALLVNVSIFIFARAIFYSSHRHKGLLTLGTLFLYGIAYLLASRIMFAWLLVVTLGFSFYYVIKHRKLLEGLTLVLGLIIGTVVVNKTLPLTFNRYKEVAYSSFKFDNMGRESHYNMQITEDQWNGVNFRLAVWTCGMELFKENLVLGTGLGDKDAALKEKYAEKNFQYAIQTDRNVHSNYIDILYSLGLVGFLVFAVSWLGLPIMQGLKTYNGLAVLVTLTFSAAWVSEVYFARSIGAMMTGFFLPFLLLRKKEASTSIALVKEEE